MREELLLDVPHRQVVFTIPKMLRLFFRFKRKLLNPLCLSAVRSLLKFFHTVTGFEIMSDVVAAIQTFGDRINFHPHIHCLVTEGGTGPDGAFHHVYLFHYEVIQEIFTHEVFSLLVRKKLIGLPLVEKMLSWRPTGFSAHSKVRAQTTSEAERVGKYMICPFCKGRMRIISFIQDHKVIVRIISHLELTFEAERPPPLQRFRLHWHLLLSIFGQGFLRRARNVR